MAKRAKEPEAGIVKAVDPLVDAPAEVNRPPEPPAVSGPTFGQRVGDFFRFLLRLLVLIVILSIIGIGLYLGLPLLYQRYVMPVEQNTAGMMDLQSRQAQTERQLADLQTRLQTIESVQNQHDRLLPELSERVSDLETEITARTQSLEALEELQSDLQTQNQAASAELERQVNVLKSMELLSRARLFMYQSNFGLARQDVQIARDLLASIEPGAPAPLAEELEAVLLRLDLTLTNLPDFPVAASDDLDIAWQILLSGIPESTPTVSVTPTQADLTSPTPAAADVTVTSTLPATVPLSATP